MTEAVLENETCTTGISEPWCLGTQVWAVTAKQTGHLQTLSLYVQVYMH